MKNITLENSRGQRVLEELGYAAQEIVSYTFSDTLTTEISRVNGPYSLRTQQREVEDIEYLILGCCPPDIG